MGKEYINKIIASGIIADIKEKKGHYQVEFISKQMGSSQGISLKMVCFNEIPAWAMAKSARADIKGHLETITFTDERGNQVTKQKYVIDEFTKRKTQTMEEFGIEGLYPAPQEFKMLLSGKVMKVREDNNWIRLMLLTGAEGRQATASLSMRMPKNGFSIKEGDTAYCVCTAITNKKQNAEGAIVYYEDLLISDIAA